MATKTPLSSSGVDTSISRSSDMSPGAMVSKMPWMRRASFYPAEYIMMLTSSLGLTFSLSFLGAAIVGNLLDQPLAQVVSPGVMYLVASVIVGLPVHLAFYWRVRHTERRTLSQAALRVAHAALAIYLIVIVSTLVSLATWLVYAWLNVAFGFSDYGDGLLAVSLSLVLAIAWMKYSAWHFVRARTARARPRNYVTIVTTVAAAVVVLGLVFPGQASKGVARDNTKEADLSQIEVAVNDYFTENNDLPTSLLSLNLGSEIKDRLSDYEYKTQSSTDYQLCATFDNSSSESPYSFSSYHHSSGRQCFSRTAYSSSSYYDFDNLNLDSGGSSDTENSLQQYLDSGALDSL